MKEIIIIEGNITTTTTMSIVQVKKDGATRSVFFCVRFLPLFLVLRLLL
jgi:hypothetical protein